MARTSRAAAAASAVAAIAIALPLSAGAANLPLAVVASSTLQSAFVKIDSAPRFSFADSDLLANSLRQGVRGVDVYAGAGARQAQALYQQRIVGKPVSFASTRLVLIVPRGNPGHVHSVRDLRSKRVSLLLADASVSVGNQARTVLSRLKLTGAVKKAKRGNDDPAKIAGQIAARKADAAIVYATSIAAVRRKLRVITIPAKGIPRVTLQIAVVNHAPDPAGAAAFIRKVRSRAGKTQLKRAGFSTP